MWLSESIKYHLKCSWNIKTTLSILYRQTAPVFSHFIDPIPNLLHNHQGPQCFVSLHILSLCFPFFTFADQGCCGTEQWSNKSACLFFSTGTSSSSRSMLSLNSLTGCGTITAATPHLQSTHWPSTLLDERGEGQGWWAHTTVWWDEHCLAGRALHQWDSIMTHLF